MIKIGFWKSEQEPDLPDPNDFVDPDWDVQVRRMVVRYLNSGKESAAYRGMSRCRFCRRFNGNCDLTDGVYLWPDGLPHYLEAHQVRLPEEFVQHVLDRMQAEPDTKFLPYTPERLKNIDVRTKKRTR